MFLIRADGNEKTGIGHIMRCLTIGTELARLTSREAVLFLCADEKSAKPVRQQGFQACVLGTDYRNMTSELPYWEQILAERGLKTLCRGKTSANITVDLQQDIRPVILVDSYYVTNEYLKRLRSFGEVALMDDLGKKKHPVDIVINYNVTADCESYQRLYENTNVRMLLGSTYAPLREQFSNRDYQVRKKAKTVLITVGGGDLENITGRILQELFEDELEYHVVAGRFNPNYQALMQAAEHHENVRFHCDVTDMAGLMTAADIAVTAGGSTVYELASLGVPFICFSCAENQEPLTEYIGNHNIAGFAGAFHRDPQAAAERLSILFKRLVAEEKLRRQYHCREKKLVDGLGARRLALALTEMSRAGDTGAGDAKEGCPLSAEWEEK